MLDNIMPHRYFQDLLPELKHRALGLDIFYEQKANLTLRRMCALADAGVNLIQPGIEGLSDHMLELMKKGVKTSQNIAALRYARSVGVAVNWNLLYAFPGDEEANYRQMRDPARCSPIDWAVWLSDLSVDRFSPYHDRPEQYGISGVRPMSAYAEVFPDSCDRERIAYHFEGDYDCAARRDQPLLGELNAAIEAWCALWDGENAGPPILAMRRLDDGHFLIADIAPDLHQGISYYQSCAGQSGVA